MAASVFFVVELDVQPGQADALRQVAREMVDLSQANEPGTLNYEYFLSADGSTCHIFERYMDIDALQRHSQSFPPELSRRAQSFRPRRLTAYGKVPEEVRAQRVDPIRQAVPGFTAAYMEPLSGFSR